MAAVSLRLLGGVKAVDGGIRLMARDWRRGSQTLERALDPEVLRGVTIRRTLRINTTVHEAPFLPLAIPGCQAHGRRLPASDCAKALIHRVHAQLAARRRRPGGHTFSLDHSPRPPLTSFRLWRPELRRAVMKVRPEYFTWPAEQQERYGSAIPEPDRAALDATLLAELFGRTFATQEEAADATDAIPPEERNRWNELILPLTGIGDDHFYLNEWFAEGHSILSFDTVRDFDEADYRFQEEARKEGDSAYAGKPYRGSLYLNWARLYVDGRFTYATLSMAAGYIYSQLSGAAHDLLEERIPHQFVPGKNHGGMEGDHIRWDLRVDANGQEGILEELRQRIWGYEEMRWDALLSAWDESARSGVYLLHQSHSDEDNLHVVFTDKGSLAAVRFRSFVRDCRTMRRSSKELEGALDEERSALARFVEDQHADVMRTYDPKLSRLEKRRKVLVRKGAFDELK